MSADHDSTQDPNSSFHDTCNGLSEPVGTLTGAVFGYGTYGAAAETGPLAPAAAYAVGHYHLDDQVAQTVGGFVNDGWHDVCHTAETVGTGATVAWNELTQQASEFGQTVADGATVAWNELGQQTAELGHTLEETSGTWFDKAVDQVSVFFGGDPSEPAPSQNDGGFFGSGSESQADGGWSLWGGGEKPNTTGDSPFWGGSESGTDASPSWGGSDSSSSAGSSDSGSSSSWGSSDSGGSTSSSPSSDDA